MKSENPTGPLLTPEQLAARWGVCMHTLRRNKRLRVIKLSPRLHRYALAEIEAIERGEVKLIAKARVNL